MRGRHRVQHDPGDLGEIRVLHEQRFLCWAVCQEPADRVVYLAHDDVSLNDGSSRPTMEDSTVASLEG